MKDVNLLGVCIGVPQLLGNYHLGLQDLGFRV